MAAPSILHCLLAISLLSCAAHAQLRANFYADCCPNLEAIVRAGMIKAIRADRRAGASLLRMFFHDCFVQVIYTVYNSHLHTDTYVQVRSAHCNWLIVLGL